MDIKKRLKNYDIRLTKLASDMNISRPTLDMYISNYQNGIPIPNEKYQHVFDHLFGDEGVSTIEFAIKYDRAKQIIENDKSSNDRKYIIKEKLISIIHQDQIDINLMEFIQLFINNSDNDLVKAIYLYFNYTNGFSMIEGNNLSEKDKNLYSQLYYLFSSYLENKITFNKESYNDFLEKNKKMFTKKNLDESTVEVVEYIKKQLQDNSEIDYDLINQIIKKNKGE